MSAYVSKLDWTLKIVILILSPCRNPIRKPILSSCIRLLAPGRALAARRESFKIQFQSAFATSTCAVLFSGILKRIENRSVSKQCFKYTYWILIHLNCLASLCILMESILFWHMFYLVVIANPLIRKMLNHWSAYRRVFRSVSSSPSHWIHSFVVGHFTVAF